MTMRKLFFFFMAMLFLTGIRAQKVAYEVSFPNAVHHEARIALTVTGIPLKPAIFRMSRSSPGRYATHEFGKNVYDVSANDLSGNVLPIKRIEGDVYEVSNHKGAISVRYTLYGNYADGTYAGIDPGSIHLNMPASFMWMKGMDNAPITIRFDLPKENKGIYATQLVPTKEPNVFTAPGLQYFMDSPTKIGDLIFRTWTISNPNGQNFTMRMALEADATEEQADEMAGYAKKIVQEARSVYGEFPRYDHGTYTFIASANPYVYGDGMEHRNSTMISQRQASFNPKALQGVFSHEYFHNWNVERIRPKTLEPFNFEHSNMSNELWFAEGFTQYYGVLILERAGLMPLSTYLAVSAGLVNTKDNTPGAIGYSPVQASNHAVFVDAGVSVDKTNYGNMFTSYYPYGAAIALALDLELQERYHKTLDSYMQAMWKRFGKTEIPYTLATMEETLASVTDAAFAKNFFSKYITGHEPIDYQALFAKAGYEIINSNQGKASLGLSVKGDGKLSISANTLKGTAAYEAGLDIDDEIVSIDGNEVTSIGDINTLIRDKKPGDAVTIGFKHRGTEMKTTAVLKEMNTPAILPFEQSGKTVTEDMKAIRNSWLNSHIK
jgi:predicted metalloprotease with PDZ domain